MDIQVKSDGFFFPTVEFIPEDSEDRMELVLKKQLEKKKPYDEHLCHVALLMQVPQMILLPREPDRQNEFSVMNNCNGELSMASATSRASEKIADDRIISAIVTPFSKEGMNEPGASANKPANAGMVQVDVSTKTDTTIADASIKSIIQSDTEKYLTSAMRNERQSSEWQHDPASAETPQSHYVWMASNLLAGQPQLSDQSPTPAIGQKTCEDDAKMLNVSAIPQQPEWLPAITAADRIFSVTAAPLSKDDGVELSSSVERAQPTVAQAAMAPAMAILPSAYGSNQISVSMHRPTIPAVTPRTSLASILDASRKLMYENDAKTHPISTTKEVARPSDLQQDGSIPELNENQYVRSTSFAPTLMESRSHATGNNVERRSRYENDVSILGMEHDENAGGKDMVIGFRSWGPGHQVRVSWPTAFQSARFSLQPSSGLVERQLSQHAGASNVEQWLVRPFNDDEHPRGHRQYVALDGEEEP